MSANGQTRAQELADEAIRRLRAGESPQAAGLLTSEGAAVGCDAYAQVVLDLYWKHKDLRWSRLFADSGIRFAMIWAFAAGKDEKAAARFRSAAKAMAYNIASFSWPGWDEPGITITPDDVAAGVGEARLNLELARELEKGDIALSRAHWLVGAMQLAQGEREEALASFREAQRHADASAQSSADAALCRAYVALAERLIDPADAARAAAFEAARAELASAEHGAELVAQIDMAWRVFGPGGSWAQKSGHSGASPRQ